MALHFIKQNQFEDVCHENQMSLIFYSAPRPIQWETPGSLVRSAVWNTLSRDPFPISHVDVFIGQKGKKPVLAGMSRVKSIKTHLEMLMSGRSMDFLVDTYPGCWIEPKGQWNLLKKWVSTERIRSLNFKISEERTEQVSRYVKEYEEKGLHKKYAGFLSNPFSGEGAGCAAFAISCLMAADLLEPQFIDSWSRKLKVPKRSLKSFGGENHVPVWKFLTHLTDDSWADALEPSVDLPVFDPDLMFQWVGAQSKNLWDLSAKVSLIGKAMQIDVDRRQLSSAPRDPWLQNWPPVPSTTSS